MEHDIPPATDRPFHPRYRKGESLMSRQFLRVLCLSLILSIAGLSSLQADRPRKTRPLFRYGFRTSRPADPYANPYTDVRYWYPKYYWGIHYREFHRVGYPTGDYPIRGTAW